MAFNDTVQDASFTPDIPDSKITPERAPYEPVGHFRFWAQKVLPTVYDDSLSYYEILTKLTWHINKMIEDMDNFNQTIDSTLEAYNSTQDYVNGIKDTMIATYNQLQDYVNHYFDNLDVQNEINNKLDSMASSGVLTSLVSPLIPSAVTEWMNNHITPTSPTVDRSLTVLDAAADALYTGNNIRTINKSALIDSNIINTRERKNTLTDTYYELLTSYRLGKFDIDGHNDNLRSVYCKLPSGTYEIICDSTNTIFSAYSYDSETTGTLLINERNSDISVSSNNPICVNLRKYDNSNLNNNDIENLLQSIHINQLGNKLSNITSNSEVNNKIAELYVSNAPVGSVNITRIIINNDGFNIALSSTIIGDWCCYASFPYKPEIGKVYEIGEFRGSNISAYIIFKNVDNVSLSGTFSISSECYDINNLYNIRQYLMNAINDKSTDVCTNSQLNDIIGELYISGGSYGDVRIQRVIINENGWNIALYSNTIGDWCSYVSYTGNPAVNVVYKIPERDNSGISAYVVFVKRPQIAISGSSIWCTEPCFNVSNWKTIENYFSDNTAKNENKITEIENIIVNLHSTQSVLFLGDSIFGINRSDTTSIPARVSQYTGATCYNCALGGTEGNSHGTSSIWRYFDFTELSKAIVSGDYSNQIAHQSDSGVPAYFASVFSTLSSLDMTTIDVICVTYGGNDYGNEHGTVTDFINAMCDNINRILNAYPNIRFMLMNPPYKRFLDPSTHAYIDDGDTRVNANGFTLRDFADSYKTISENTHSPYIDAYNDMGIGRYNAEQWFAENDGSHPSETGCKETGKLIAAKLNSYLYD